MIKRMDLEQNQMRVCGLNEFPAVSKFKDRAITEIANKEQRHLIEHLCYLWYLRQQVRLKDRGIAA